jgi:hypothetical protein
MKSEKMISKKTIYIIIALLFVMVLIYLVFFKKESSDTEGFRRRRRRRSSYRKRSPMPTQKPIGAPAPMRKGPPKGRREECRVLLGLSAKQLEMINKGKY